MNKKGFKRISTKLRTTWLEQTFSFLTEANSRNTFKCPCSFSSCRFSTYFFIFIFYCCSSTVVSIFSLPLPVTPAIHTSLSRSLASTGFVHVSFIVVPENPSPLYIFINATPTCIYDFLVFISLKLPKYKVSS